LKIAAARLNRLIEAQVWQEKAMETKMKRWKTPTMTRRKKNQKMKMRVKRKRMRMVMRSRRRLLLQQRERHAHSLVRSEGGKKIAADRQQQGEERAVDDSISFCFEI
jgi:hypothetical protein